MNKHLSRVASLGCIVCRNLDLGESPALIHHIRDGYGWSQRAPDEESIPLCYIHHVGKAGGQIGYHKSPKEFVERYGTERELLQQTRELLKECYP
jgi:hypothetical protein